jgi:hypothetical protein
VLLWGLLSLTALYFYLQHSVCLSKSHLFLRNKLSVWIWFSVEIFLEFTVLHPWQTSYLLLTYFFIYLSPFIAQKVFLHPRISVHFNSMWISFPSTLRKTNILFLRLSSYFSISRSQICIISHPYHSYNSVAVCSKSSPNFVLYDLVEWLKLNLLYFQW